MDTFYLDKKRNLGGAEVTGDARLDARVNGLLDENILDCLDRRQMLLQPRTRVEVFLEAAAQLKTFRV